MDTADYLDTIKRAHGPAAHLLAATAVTEAVAAEDRRWCERINRAARSASPEVREALRSIMGDAIEDAATGA